MPLERPAFIRNVDKRPPNYSVDFKPPPLSKLKNLNPSLQRHGFINQDQVKPYIYPDFVFIKQMELEQKGQKMFLNKTQFGKMFEIEIIKDGIKTKVVAPLIDIIKKSITDIPTMKRLMDMLSIGGAASVESLALIINSMGRVIMFNSPSSIITTKYHRRGRPVANSYIQVIAQSEYTIDLTTIPLPMITRISTYTTWDSIGFAKNNLVAADFIGKEIGWSLMLRLKLLANIKYPTATNADIIQILHEIIERGREFELDIFDFTL